MQYQLFSSFRKGEIIMKNIKTCIVIIATLILLIIWGCTNTVDSEVGNPGITTAGLINMPTSVAQSSFNRATSDIIDETYSYILDQNHFVNELINGDYNGSVKSLLNEMATLPWNHIIKWGNYDTTIGTERFAMTYTEGSELPYYVLLSDTTAGNAWKISANVNGDQELIKGEVNYFIENPEEIFADSLFINLEFNKTEKARYLDIKITQSLNPQASDFDGDEGKSWDYSLYEKNGILHISSGSYHPYITSFDKNAELCYIYTTVADTLQNLAKVNLSLAPSDYNGTDSLILFGTYGTAAAYSSYIIDLFKDSADDTTQMLIVTSYKDSLPIDSILIKAYLDTTYTLHDASEISNMNSDDLNLFLKLNEELSDSDFPVKELQWITKISQPIFFDMNGYADNGKVYNPKFNDIAGQDCAEVPKNPALLKSQSLSFE